MERFRVDSKRGDLLLFGGGHANYAGNEVYRQRQYAHAGVPISSPVR